MRIYAYPSTQGRSIRLIAASNRKAVEKFSGSDEARLATRSELEAALALAMMVPKLRSTGRDAGEVAEPVDFL